MGVVCVVCVSVDGCAVLFSEEEMKGTRSNARKRDKGEEEGERDSAHRNIFSTWCLLWQGDRVPMRDTERRAMDRMWLSAGSLRQYRTSTKSVNSCERKMGKRQRE